MELRDIDSDNENNTESIYGLSHFSSESDSSDQNIAASRRYYFLNSFTKNFRKIPRKTFGKSVHVYYSFRFIGLQLY